MNHLTGRWAALRATSDSSVYVVTFLVSAKGGWSPDDYVGQAVAGFPADLLSADATRGDPTSVRLRFIAPDDDTARLWAESAMRDCARWAYGADSLVVRRGRRTAFERDASVDDYGGQHQVTSPDEYGAWAYDLDVMIPADWRQHPDFYTGFKQWVRPVAAALLRVDGHPEGMLTIYRAQPKQYTSIETGNWVTLSREYANSHGQSGNAGSDWHIVSAQARADQVGFGGDDLMEWGYFGPTVTAKVV